MLRGCCGDIYEDREERYIKIERRDTYRWRGEMYKDREERYIKMERRNV